MPPPIESYWIPELKIAVEYATAPNGNRCGSVVIQREDVSDSDTSDDDSIIDPYNAALDGVETLLLALVCEGYDLREEKIRKAIAV